MSKPDLLSQSLTVDRGKLAILESSIPDFIQSYDADSSSSLLKQFFQRSQTPYYFMHPPIWKLALRLLFKQQRMTPDFACTGAVRSGDDLLSLYVMQHPCIALPLSKELFPAPVYTQAFIQAQFPSKRNEQTLIKRHGSAKTGLFSSVQPSSSWIYWCKALNPDMKFVITLRDPVERVISHWRWNQMISHNIIKDPLWDQMPNLNDVIEIEMNEVPKGGCGFQFFTGIGAAGYLRQSIYLPFIRALHENFGNDSVMLINANKLYRDPLPIIKSVYQFLDLPDYQPQAILNYNTTLKAYRFPEQEEKARTQLSNFFRPYNEALFQYLGTDIEKELGWNSHSNEK